MSACQEKFDNNNLELGYATKFDQGQGFVLIMDGEECWAEILNQIE